MLNEAIRRVLEEVGDEDVTNDELAVRVSEKLSAEEREAALLEALRAVISTRRSLANRKIFREFKPVLGTRPRPSVTGRMGTGERQYPSARGALIEDHMLQFTIVGTSGRSVPLSRAQAADLRSEIDSSRKRGTTFIRRAEIFDDMLHEMAGAQVRTPGELPSESRAAYGLRIAELVNQVL